LEGLTALGIQAGSDVQFQLDTDGARLVVDSERVANEIMRPRGAGELALGTDEILALSRR
jgi:hypothetical protein